MAETESTNVVIKITDLSPQVLAALPMAINRALWSIGAVAESYAKQHPPCPVDTGRLRGSITHVENGKQTVIGTNVEYAAAQELGTSRGIKGKHYLKNGVSAAASSLQSIIESSMANV